ncbi:hypothetical protein LOM8899_04139 [Flavimaricola marinus]|uniref:Uncharacterized protein n=1 Tax=Flavimaricola marinus TaxID=1819565 RepID=A0A238LKQ1_9RHOB|nr:hypothetical protein LOM8899_04139 [Flavimaricola marinus]
MFVAAVPTLGGSSQPYLVQFELEPTFAGLSLPHNAGDIR